MTSAFSWISLVQTKNPHMFWICFLTHFFAFFLISFMDQRYPLNGRRDMRFVNLFYGSHFLQKWQMCDEKYLTALNVALKLVFLGRDEWESSVFEGAKPDSIAIAATTNCGGDNHNDDFGVLMFDQWSPLFPPCFCEFHLWLLACLLFVFNVCFQFWKPKATEYIPSSGIPSLRYLPTSTSKYCLGACFWGYLKLFYILLLRFYFSFDVAVTSWRLYFLLVRKLLFGHGHHRDDDDGGCCCCVLVRSLLL